MRTLIAFDCDGETLIGTLDAAYSYPGGGRGPDGEPERLHTNVAQLAPGLRRGTARTERRTGLLIVSGGNEIRSGAHRGMAMLAANLAARGIPVFRFDRRGIGDSCGQNHGFRSSAPDIAAAARTFRTQVPLDRLVAFGNCDAASALALFGRAAEIDALILANPWVVEPVDDLPPAAAIRARYADRMRDPGAWRRLLTGGISARKLVRGLFRIAAPSPLGSADVLAAITGWGHAATVILATGDSAAIAYADVARGKSPPIRLDTASHSFADTGDLLAETIHGVANKDA